MQGEINLVFYKKGLRSLIEVDLCGNCPRQDDKGCCGYYSPVFYLTDLAFLAWQAPDVLKKIFEFSRLTILDASITVNSIPDGKDTFHCQFHTRDQGCLLPIELRESVCRHFVCPGIAWWKEKKLQGWKEFFDQLSEFEIALNQTIAAELREKRISLRNLKDRDPLIDHLLANMDFGLYAEVPFGQGLPSIESVQLTRELSFGRDWTL